MNPERAARLFVFGLLLGLSLIILASRWIGDIPPASRAIEMRAKLPEAGGWYPNELRATVGEPIRLRLTSDDVMHGFALGQSELPAVDVKPGEVTEITLSFEKPGKYVFYCTRWCGVNHWRMRGTIEVEGTGDATDAEPPLFVSLGIDIDAPHPARDIPARIPNAARGAELSIDVPGGYLELAYYRSHSPAEIWGMLRGESVTQALNDDEVWDLVAWVWSINTSKAGIAEGRALYTDNCAACHGEAGAGNGVMAAQIGELSHEHGHGITQPTDFSDSTAMLGASPALLQGKIVRGGMGTGMPYWGPIFSDRQTWAVVDYLWTFQFELEQTR